MHATFIIPSIVGSQILILNLLVKFKCLLILFENFLWPLSKHFSYYCFIFYTDVFFFSLFFLNANLSEKVVCTKIETGGFPSSMIDTCFEIWMPFLLSSLCKSSKGFEGHKRTHFESIRKKKVIEVLRSKYFKIVRIVCVIF